MDKMDTDTIRKVIGNLRNPINVKARIHFTARSILFITSIFENKRIDIIELHTVLLRLAHVCGCFGETKKFISLKDLVVFLYSHSPTCISYNDISSVAKLFNVTNDSDYKEVEDMKIIVESIHI